MASGKSDSLDEIDKCLKQITETDTHKIDYLNISICAEEIDLPVKTFPQRKLEALLVSLVISIKYFRKK